MFLCNVILVFIYLSHFLNLELQVYWILLQFWKLIDIVLLFYLLALCILCISLGICRPKNISLYTHQSCQKPAKLSCRKHTEYCWHFQAWSRLWLPTLDIIAEFQSVKRLQVFFSSKIHFLCFRTYFEKSSVLFIWFRSASYACASYSYNMINYRLSPKIKLIGNGEFKITSI